MAGDGSYPTGYTLADMLVLSKVKAALGLDQLKYAVTGVWEFVRFPADSKRSQEFNLTILKRSQPASLSCSVTACHSMSQHTSMGQELLPSVWTLWSILDRWAWTSMSCTACQYHGGFGQNMWWWELDLKSYLSFLSGCQLTIEIAWNCEFFFHRGVC